MLLFKYLNKGKKIVTTVFILSLVSLCLSFVHCIREAAQFNPGFANKVSMCHSSASHVYLRTGLFLERCPAHAETDRFFYMEVPESERPRGRNRMLSCMVHSASSGQRKYFFCPELVFSQCRYCQVLFFI